MSDPFVTIAIPFYNAEKYLLDSVRSIFAQTYTNWELLLIDDGSTDRSLEIARSIDDERVKIFSDGLNKKLACRLNQVIDLSQGEFIARMDADDLCSPDKISKQIAFLQEHKEADLVGTEIVYLSESAMPLGQSLTVSAHEDICRQPYRGFRLCHSSIVARKSWYKRNRYDEKIHLGQDFNLWLKSYKNSHFRNISEPLYYYRIEASYRLRKQCKNRIISASYLFEHFARQGLLGKALFSSSVQYLKMLAEAVFFVFGAKNSFLRRRYQQLTPEDREKYRSIIQRIIETKLPLKRS